MRRTAVLMTCFNRRETTLECLDALFAQEIEQICELSVYLVDDGSSDGTGEAVRLRFPDMTVIRGSGELYWNGGMHLAWSRALESPEPFDFFLMLNDDTVLLPGALQAMFEMYDQFGDPVVVASVADPDTRALNYGGFVRSSRLSPLRIRLGELGTQEPLATMNGNCVLLSTGLVSEIGILDPSYTHRFGDVDLGFRVTEAGRSLVATNEVVGLCASNPFDDVKTHASEVSFADWWRHLLSVKGIPVDDWRHYSKKHGGRLWPLWFGFAYLNLVRQWPTAQVARLRGIAH